ncbi:MAG: phosphodiester glycosidase family protein [Clostridia bacterium]|nr:phosphodiester glycosidase family protein [Clostridia bacterium]
MYFCHRPWGKYLITTLISLVTEAALVLFLLYGPINFFRELIITSAMTTLSHQYYATTFYSNETIQQVMDKNKVINPTTTTDVDAITKLNRGELTVRKISGSGYNGFVMEIPDPSWVRLGLPQNYGTKGQKIPKLIEDYGAIAGINAGGFGDANGWGNGGNAIGLVIVDGVTIQGPQYQTFANVVGFNEDDVLVLGRYNTTELPSLKLRDAVEFSPFLIINGEPTEIRGNGGWGVAPRTAIGQRQDGTVIFVVIDGRSITSAGATMKQLQEVLIEEECYNAANLDGGSSTVLYYTKGGGVLNNPSGSDKDGMRFLPNAWLVIDPKTYTPLTDRPPHNGEY